MSDHEDECDRMGCDFAAFDETDDMTIWHCKRCGAEAWEEYDNA